MASTTATVTSADSAEAVTPQASRVDAMVVATVSLLSASGYVGRLGFYGDDWFFLAPSSQASAHSILGLFRHLLHLDPGRPVQILVLATLFRAFGLHPLGYHLVNAVVQAIVAMLLYLVARRMRLHRAPALALSALYSLLPHYSTDLFWMAAFQGELSVLFFLTAFYAALRAFESGERHDRLWMAISGVCIALSVLSYEITLGLFVLFPIAILWRDWELRRQWSPALRRRVLGYTLLAAALGAPLVIAKLVLRPVQYHGNFFHHLGALFVHAVGQLFEFNFVRYGLRLPWVAWKAAHHVPWPVFLLAASVGTLLYWFLLGALQSIPPMRFYARRGLVIIGLGCVVFFLGYGFFAANLNMDFTTTGVENRLSIASALGAAMVMLGAFEAAAALVRTQKVQRYFFCALVAMVCALNTVVVNSIASWWQAAYAQQQVVLADIHQHLPVIPAGTSLLLDGVCPYIGPGIVFDAWWDVGPALQIAYADPTLRGDAVSPRIRLGQGELTTVIYESITASYAYGDQLWIYNFRDKGVYKIPDAAAAQHYFGTIAPARNSNCEGNVGQGIPIF